MEGVFPIPRLAGSMFVAGNGAYLRCVVLAAKFVAQKMVTQPRDRNVLDIFGSTPVGNQEARSLFR